MTRNDDAFLFNLPYPVRDSGYSHVHHLMQLEDPEGLIWHSVFDVCAAGFIRADGADDRYGGMFKYIPGPGFATLEDAVKAYVVFVRLGG